MECWAKSLEFNNKTKSLNKNIFLFLVASQMYKTSGNEEYVIVGNDVIMKCNIPSFVADFVSVQSWQDSEGLEFHSGSNYGNFRALSSA